MKIRLSKRPKIEEVRCQSWRDFWTGEGQGPQCWPGIISLLGAVTTCGYDCRVLAENVVNQISCLSTEKEHQNRLSALLCLGKVGNMMQKLIAALYMYAVKLKAGPRLGVLKFKLVQI